MSSKIEKWLINEEIKTDVISLISLLEVSKDKPISIIICDKKITRSDKQNKYLFGWVYGCALTIFEKSGIEVAPGIPWTKDTFHNAMAETFLIKSEIVLPSGKIVKERYSTATLPKKSNPNEESNEPTFGWYVDQVKQFCESYYGFQIPDPISANWRSLMEDVL